jgi:soluble lytic murein transglycosylase-like protein
VQVSFQLNPTQIKRVIKQHEQVWRRDKHNKLKGRNVFDPHVNIQTGVKILSNCLKKHRTNKRALGCYNGVRSVKGIQAYYDKVSKKRERIKRLVM